MFAENEVTAISSLRGASGNFWLRILKGRPRLYMHVQLTLFVYLEQFRRNSTFYIWLGIPYGGGRRNFGVVEGKSTPKTASERKTLAGKALPYAKLRLLSHCAWNYLYPFGLCRCARKKGRKAGRKKKSQEVYISGMRGETSSRRNPIKLSKCVRLTDVISNVQSCIVIISWVVSELWGVEFPCCHGEPWP